VKSSRFVLVVPLCAAVVLAACGGDESTATPTVPPRPRLVIGFGDRRESRLVTEIYAQALEQAGFRVARKDTVLDRAGALAALQSGEIQLYVDYSNSLLVELDPAAEPVPATTIPATTLPAATTTVASTESTTTTTTSSTSTTTTVFDPAATTTSTSTTLSPLGKVLPDTLTLGLESSVNVVPVIACKLPAEITITNLSQLAEFDDDLRLAAPADFATSMPLGASVLADVYDAEFSEVITTPADEIAAAIEAGDADCGLLSNIDPAMSAQSLVVLADDRGAVPPQLIVPVIAGDVASAELLSVVDSATALLTDPTMRALLKGTEIDGITTEVLVNSFLAAQ
jgi:osmoprotectant transport system substrate-binding protein